MWFNFFKKSLLLACLSTLLWACAPEEDDPELDETFGAGSTGNAVSTEAANLTQVTLVDAEGGSIGSLTYDQSYFFDASAALEDTTFTQLLLVDSLEETDANRLSIQVSRIIGLPATSCRFQAAVLARDYEYEILESGDRENDHKLSFHQVNLKKEPLFQSNYCTKLKGNLGIMMTAITADESKLSSLQLHYVLNSILGAD